jgi:hypothetical protein
LLITDMRAHDRTEYQQQMGHVWLGFDAPTLERWLTDAGFTGMRYTPLPVDPDAEGPALFTAVSMSLPAADMVLAESSELSVPFLSL